MNILEPADHAKAEKAMKGAEFNTLFAGTVLDGSLPGKVYADDPQSPRSFLIAHPYGMSLLLGNPRNRDFNGWLAGYMLDMAGQRSKPEWVQAHPGGWHATIKGLLGAALVNGPGPAEEGKVRQLTRVNFRFDKEKFMASQKAAPGPPHKVIPTSREHFDRMQGKVIPRFFWRDADHFIREGAGYTMVVDGEPVSTAFSAFTAPGILEFGIETAEGHRGKGYAEHVCHALMRHCLDRGLEPIWACREDNAGSMRLAQRLGFVPTLKVPYYQLAQASPYFSCTKVIDR